MTSPENDDDKYFTTPIGSRKGIVSPRVGVNRSPQQQYSAGSNATKDSLILKQKIEELQKKLKEEQDVKAELLRRAQDVLQSKKQLREAYVALVEEKEALDENLRQLMKANEGINESPPSFHVNKKNEYEALKRDNEDLHQKLKDKQEQEVREREILKNETTQKSPEVLAKLEENERLKKTN